MKLQERINAFVALGTFLKQFSKEDNLTENQENSDNPTPFNTDFYAEMLQTIHKAHHHNTWFTNDNMAFAFHSWSQALTKVNLEKWVSNYNISEVTSPKTIAIIMAGNIPMVGFHDFLTVLISGHKVLVKQSSNDNQLLPLLAKYLIAIEPSFKEAIQFTDGKLENFDAMIATGSNNTARYFDYYFKKYPHIIRKNRNSVAIITGSETQEQMEALADDVFRYFGLGCRNVSKVYLPETYDLDHFFNAMFSWKHVINNHKYINNYDYNKAVYLMSDVKLLDNEFMLLKEDKGFSSPISVVFYERYSNMETIRTQLAAQEENIQCIVSKTDVPFGVAQTPQLWDYADGVDTMDFLLGL